jgi:hypothetical protein
MLNYYRKKAIFKSTFSDFNKVGEPVNSIEYIILAKFHDRVLRFLWNWVGKLIGKQLLGRANRLLFFCYLFGI